MAASRWGSSRCCFAEVLVIFLAVVVVALSVLKVSASKRDYDDDEFAEFDREDEHDEVYDVDADVIDAPEDSKYATDEVKDSAPAKEDSFVEEDEALVEEVDSEFSHFEDEEEFENFPRSDDEEDEFEHVPPKGRGATADRRRTTPPPPIPKTLNIAKIPSHLRNNWENYYMEILMTAGIIVYFLNFFTGRAKNQRLANAWFKAHQSILESNFTLVGDDGSRDTDDVETRLQKDSESLFTLWCSGRVCCEGMLVELKLLKRQDLVSVLGYLLKPATAKDQIRFKVRMNSEDMDTFVFCLSQKKMAIKLSKEMTDLNTFCPERRVAVLDRFDVPAPACYNYTVMSEIPEVTSAMLDSKITAIISKYPDVVDSMHFSDQFTGPKLSDDQTPSQPPATQKVLLFTFNIPQMKNTAGPDEVMESMKATLMLVFHYMDKIRRYRLSREAKNKADKNRSKVSEAYWKSIHVAKAEKAQEERERKRREIKEKIREIEDPEKQRKMEDRELRRERKKNAPKMKQLKVKAM